MGFFAQFYAWLNDLLLDYIAQTVVRVATTLEPAVATLAVLYVMVWGALHLTGRIEEPLTEGLKRIGILALILGVSLRLWLYHDVIVDTFYDAPSQLAAAVVGANDPVGIADEVMFQGADAAQSLLAKGSIFGGNISYYMAGMIVFMMVGLTAVYTMFLLSLSHIALAVLLSIGPMFLVLALFEATRRFLEAWLAQLANYAFIALLSVMVAAVMLTMLIATTRQVAAVGTGIQIVDAVRVGLASGLTLLIMRQVMPMASGLASGVALSSFGAMSAVIAWGMGHASNSARQFTRGALLDKETTRWDPLSRMAGFQARRAVLGGGRRTLRALASDNTVSPSARG
ncbi:type IV secretion system protein [Peristeroidobacter soli]|uniref:type IV secretion system protein n=1 Tax=Peristeroidobacter soli TaxID=2497877 RepID=UPI00101DFD4F|nr:type IV secretion system protein [Peristeroidobacter soli]